MFSLDFRPKVTLSFLPASKELKAKEQDKGTGQRSLHCFSREVHQMNLFTSTSTDAQVLQLKASQLATKLGQSKTVPPFLESF